MPCSAEWQAIQRSYLERTLRTLQRYNINPLSTEYRRIERVGDYININMGFKVPKPITLIMRLFGLSPGELKLFYDAETGWFTEARAKEGALPVYHHVTDEVAVTILKGELTHELEVELMKPDEYIGE